jgi:two-component system OmpR family sensor kinase
MRQFIADASHELRTPLTTIRGFAELYRQGAVEPERPPNWSAHRGRGGPDGPARGGPAAARAPRRGAPARPRPVDLRVIAADAVAAAQVTAPERSIGPGDPGRRRVLVVLGDESRLRQVVGNLMTNAITHTPPEAAVLLRLAADGDEALLEVADKGPASPRPGRTGVRAVLPGRQGAHPAGRRGER